MITEDYVSFETAKLLKEKGFKEMCDSLYGLAYMHNGKYIDEDEQYELESEGRGSEIELVEGGMVYDFWYRNDKRVKHQYSRPTLQRAMKWLRKIKGCPIEILWHWDSDNQCEEWYFRHHVELKEQPQIEYFDEPEQAAEAAIKYYLENLI